MRSLKEFTPITRRTAIRAIGAGLAGAAGLPALLRAAQRDNGKPRVVETPPGGVEIWQVTTEEQRHSNIYCEIPYCSRDGKRFVYERRNPKRKDGNPTEFVVVELGTWKRDVLDAGYEGGIRATAITHDGAFYYLKRTDNNGLHLMRVDLDSGKTEPVHNFAYGTWLQTLGTVSGDKKHYAVGVRLDEQRKQFGILLVDLVKHTERVIDRDPYIFNAHPQFEPGESKHIMIQHNRGGHYGPDGKIVRLVGPEGATLYLLSIADGKRTELKVGTPHTTPITGHESWIGRTKEILLSVVAREQFAPDEKGNLLGVRSGGAPRFVTSGYKANHVGVSRCGAFYTIDDWRPPYKVIVGSTRTGKSAVLCESKTNPRRGQNSHPHAYLTPNRDWVIFNSTRGGYARIYAARVPEKIMDAIS